VSKRLDQPWWVTSRPPLSAASRKRIHDWKSRRGEVFAQRARNKASLAKAEERCDRHTKRAPGDLDLPTLDRVFQRSGNQCFYCRQPFRLRKKRSGPSYWNSRYQIEHKIPVSRGGTNDESNLVLACAPCNKAKFTMTASEFFASGFIRSKHPTRELHQRQPGERDDARSQTAFGDNPAQGKAGREVTAP
jgi:5-methylcytosine-specific restriction endonuclease McrA